MSVAASTGLRRAPCALLLVWQRLERGRGQLQAVRVQKPKGLERSFSCEHVVAPCGSRWYAVSLMVFRLSVQLVLSKWAASERSQSCLAGLRADVFVMTSLGVSIDLLNLVVVSQTQVRFRVSREWVGAALSVNRLN